MLRNLFILLVLVPALLMALRDRFMGLLLYIWFALFKPLDWIWIDVTALRPSLMLGLLLVVPSVFSGILPNLTHPLSIGNLLFLASALVAQIGAVNQALAWSWVDFLARLTLVCLLAVTLVTTPQRLIRVLAVVAGSLGFHAAKAGVASLLGGGLRFQDGLSGAFVDNNGYALGTVMIMPFLAAVALNAQLLFEDRHAWLAWWAKRGFLVAAHAQVLFENRHAWLTRWARRGFLLAVPLCAFTVISTFSRGGFLALTAATLVFIGLHRRRLRLSLALAAVIVIGWSVVPIPDGYFDRLSTIPRYEDIGEESALSRQHFWRVATRMAENRPFGVGLRNYEAAYDAYDFSYGQYGFRRAVHSSHFQVLAELGYVGAVVWVVQFGLAFLIALRVRRRSRTPGLPETTARFMYTVSNCVMASMAGFVAGGSFISLALNDVTWLTFALVAALDRMADGLCAGAADSAPAAAVVPAPRTPWQPPSRAARGLTGTQV